MGVTDEHEFWMIQNDGKRIKQTNYWLTQAALRGYAFISINSGAIRVLLPEVHIPDFLANVTRDRALYVQEGNRVSVVWRVHDDPNDVWRLETSIHAVDRRLPPEDHMRECDLIVYGPGNEPDSVRVVWEGRARILIQPPKTSDPTEEEGDE